MQLSWVDTIVLDQCAQCLAFSQYVFKDDKWSVECADGCGNAIDPVKHKDIAMVNWNKAQRAYNEC